MLCPICNQGLIEIFADIKKSSGRKECQRLIQGKFGLITHFETNYGCNQNIYKETARIDKYSISNLFYNNTYVCHIFDVEKEYTVLANLKYKVNIGPNIETTIKTILMLL